MGKGGGCFPSKQTTAARTREIEAPIEGDLTTEAATANSHPPPAAKVKVYIVFYSTYGHVESIARTMKKGVESVEGVEGVLYRVPETLSKEILEMLKAKPQDESIPVLTAQELADADGILFGFPTRFGMMPVQMKAFLDTTGGLWKEQKLAGKPAGIFISTSSQGGGQETTAWTAITQLTHHGMLFVPIGYTFGADMFTMDKTQAGSPYGAGVYAGDGTRQASEMELAIAEYQGKYMAGIVKRLAQH